MKTILNRKGYGIPRAELTASQEVALKEELTVKPNVLPDYDYGDVKSYPTYRMNSKYYYVPKFWGIENYGPPTVVNEKEGDYIDHQFKGELRDHQVKYCDVILEELKNNGSTIACSTVGSGKCKAINTPVIMYNGVVKMVQDIVVGDQLMGEDSMPRNVLSLGRGRDTMYEVVPIKGTIYTFNSEHILSLKITSLGVSFEKRNTNRCWKAKYLDKKTLKNKSLSFKEKHEAETFLKKMNNINDIVDIAIKDYIKLNKFIKQSLKLYRVPVDFPHREVPFDPYIIGFWIGDGTSANTGITTQDSVVVKYLKESLGKYNCYLHYYENRRKYNHYHYKIDTLGSKNYFLQVLKDLNLLNNKHIPELYKINSRKVRLELLAGLMDSDGHNAGGYFEFVQKKEETAEGVAYLARSLGFAAYKRVKKTSWIYKGIKKFGTAFRVTISGNVDEIPVKISRKKQNPRKQKKDVLVSGFKVVEKPVGDYYGFELDGNHRYLLGDFTVTHNTVMALHLLAKLKKRTLIIVHKQFLMDQWIERINQFLPDASVGIIKQKVCEINNDIVIGMIHSITMREYPPGTLDGFQNVVFDECHHISSHTFSRALFKTGGTKYRLGLSATPTRKDGLTKVIEWFLGKIIINNKVSDVQIPSVKIISAVYSGTLKPKYNWKKKLITANMETQIANDLGRTKQIVKEITEFSKIGRKILVLSGRRILCEKMEELLLDLPEFGPGLKTVGMYLGGMKNEKLDESNKCDVILATYSIASEGYDNPGLDTLIMGTGRSDIKQICGRILRRRNKFSPLIVDFTDTDYFAGQARRRVVFYKKENYTNYETGLSFKLKKPQRKIQEEVQDEPMFV